MVPFTPFGAGVGVGASFLGAGVAIGGTGVGVGVAFGAQAGISKLITTRTPTKLNSIFFIFFSSSLSYGRRLSSADGKVVNTFFSFGP
jgi:F0F1-type ATP synthase membrane subunit c/vacuolar-type H+-ATPase subunit K